MSELPSVGDVVRHVEPFGGSWVFSCDPYNRIWVEDGDTGLVVARTTTGQHIFVLVWRLGVEIMVPDWAFVPLNPFEKPIWEKITGEEVNG